LFSFTDNSFIEAALVILILIPSIIVHEVSHGFVADKLGDSTARDAGRLTLNPIPHIDPFGSVLLPAMLALANGPLFGWAKPVPVNAGRFTNPTSHMAITAVAGPISNIVMAALLARLLYPSLSGVPGEIVFWRGREIFRQFEQFGFIILFALLFFLEGSLDFMTDWVVWLLDLLIA
jgi:Zn-dependent protease